MILRDVDSIVFSLHSVLVPSFSGIGWLNSLELFEHLPVVCVYPINLQLSLPIVQALLLLNRGN